MFATLRPSMRSLSFVIALLNGPMVTLLLAEEPPDTSRIGPALLYAFCDAGRWGYIDAQGEMRVPPKFAWADDFSEGYAGVSDGATMGYIDIEGQLTIRLPPGTEMAWPFSEGRAWFRRNGKYGCIDPRGTVLIEPRYDSCLSFSEGLAAVMVIKRFQGSEGKPPFKEVWGYVDSEGGTAIRPQYTYASSFGDGRAFVREERAATLTMIDRDQNPIPFADNVSLAPDDFVGSTEPFKEGFAAIHIDGRSARAPYGCFVNPHGAVLRGQYFSGVASFSEGLAAVVQDNKTGYVDSRGRLAIPPRFDLGSDFQEGLCLVRLGVTYKFVNRSGEVALEGSEPAAYWNDGEGFQGELARIHIGGKFQATDDGPNRWRGGKWCYINKEGKVVAVCRSDDDVAATRCFGLESPGVIP